MREGRMKIKILTGRDISDSGGRQVSQFIVFDWRIYYDQQIREEFAVYR